MDDVIDLERFFSVHKDDLGLMVERILRHGSDVTPDEFRETMAKVKGLGGSDWFVRPYGAPTTKENILEKRYRRTLLHEIARNGSPAFMVPILVEEFGLDPCFKDHRDLLPGDFAVRFSHAHCLEALLKYRHEDIILKKMISMAVHERCILILLRHGACLLKDFMALPFSGSQDIRVVMSRVRSIMVLTACQTVLQSQKKPFLSQDLLKHLKTFIN